MTSTPVYASRVDQRFGFCLFVPDDLGPGRAPLVVVQHGTDRDFMHDRDHLQSFAEEHRVVLLAPLFPAGIIEPGDLDGYKFIDFHGIRFDQVLLAIVDEVAERWPVDVARFYLHGFSGGGQFAHRFLYLHPDRLAGVSIGAPGRITRLDDTLPWWTGTQDWEERFGRPIDLDAVRRVPVLMVVGDRDIPRVDGLRALQRSFEAHGIGVRLEIVPGVGHHGESILAPVRDFLAGLIARES